MARLLEPIQIFMIEREWVHFVLVEADFAGVAGSYGEIEDSTQLKNPTKNQTKWAIHSQLMAVW